jgi:hypothetical protein
VAFFSLDFPAVSVVTGRDFPAVSVDTDFPAVSVDTDFPAVSVLSGREDFSSTGECKKLCRRRKNVPVSTAGLSILGIGIF